MTDFLATVLPNHTFSVIVWDKYGYHGLVGFASLKSRLKFTHFVFSCRIMNMGIENWFLHELMRLIPELDVSNIPVVPKNVDWIHHEEGIHVPAIRAMIWEKEKEKSTTDIKLRIMGGCQSGAWAHYAGLGNIADTDHGTRRFDLMSFPDDDCRDQNFPALLVYLAPPYFPVPGEETNGRPSPYEECVTRFCNFVSENNKKLLVVLAPNDLHTNFIWEKIALLHAEVFLLHVGDIATKDELIDSYHYKPVVLKKIGAYVRLWFDQKQETLSDRAAA